MKSVTKKTTRWPGREWLTTLCSRYSRNQARVIEPSTTVHETIPSRLSRPLAEKCHAQTKTPFWTAWMPFKERPRFQKDVRSSLDTSSRNPSCSGAYWAIRQIKSALIASFLSDVIFLIFFDETPARTSSWWIVVLPWTEIVRSPNSG